ncbi:endonuclease/exonuclease/phosphatase family protein [Kitasatospora sp. NPDC001540]|uniref:endonuclease/exonuclease/phosphatase family protein n=1 Tax=Kitasatospora sp. NPDC001540 TaxID=3364014 RepID=UPI00368AD1C4
MANLNAYKLGPHLVGTDRWRALVATIREIRPDVLCLQEIVADEEPRSGESFSDRDARWRAEAETVVQHLAGDCGLSSSTLRSDRTYGGVAMANNVHRGWFTAVLWNPTAAGPVPGGFRPIGAPDFWHGLTSVRLDLGAREPVTICSYHGDPFRPRHRLDEALRLKGLLRRTGGAQPGFVCCDANSISAATHSRDGGPALYYDAEPYTHQTHDDLEYQVLEGTLGTTNLADRRPTEVLLRGGFTVDAAAHLGVPWEATVGYWEDGRGDPDPWGERRIDLVLATRPVVGAVAGYRIHRSEAARNASDHLPVVVDVDPAALPGRVGPPRGREHPLRTGASTPAEGPHARHHR